MFYIVCVDEQKCNFICTRCAGGFYLVDNKCDDCNIACETCYGGGDNSCYKCKEGYYYSETEHKLAGCDFFV